MTIPRGSVPWDLAMKIALLWLLAVIPLEAGCVYLVSAFERPSSIASMAGDVFILLTLLTPAVAAWVHRSGRIGGFAVLFFWLLGWGYAVAQSAANSAGSTQELATPAALAGLVLLLDFGVAALLLARWKHFSWTRIAYCHLGVLIGGGLIAIPGWQIWFLIAFASSGLGAPENMLTLGSVVLTAAVAAGSLVGLWIVNRVVSQEQARGACATALAGFITGVGASCLAYGLMNSTIQVNRAIDSNHVELYVPGPPDWSLGVLLPLAPLAVAAATIAGYSLRA